VNGCVSLDLGDGDGVDGGDLFSRVTLLMSQAAKVFQKRAADLKIEAFKVQQSEQSLEERRQWNQQQVEEAEGRPVPVACLIQSLDLRIRSVSYILPSMLFTT
jgi:hypothetical protein